MKRRLLLIAPLLLACGPSFYMAPPPIDAYPQRIPGKLWTDVLNESRPLAGDAADEEALILECSVLASGFLELAEEQRLAKIDDLLERNREGQFHSRVANLLHELREMAGDEPTIEVAGRYIEWRLKHLAATDFGTWEPFRRWDMDDEEFDAEIAAHAIKREIPIKELDEIDAASGGRLAPQIRVQKAAVMLSQGAPELAEQLFQSVVSDFEGHPRAEVARFMLGRCMLQAARRDVRKNPKEDFFNQQVAELLNLAGVRFEDYLDHYSNGRFVPDAHGWLGAVAADREEWLKAVLHQVDRLNARPSREVLRSVLRECDWLVAKLLSSDIDAYWLGWEGYGKLAAHPEIVKLLVYQALDPAAREALPALDRNIQSDRATINFLQRRMVRPQRVARELLLGVARAMVVRGEGGADASTLLVLGWSAARDGEAAEALILFDRGLEQIRSDEFLQARAYTLGLLGRYAEAAEAWQALTREFSTSPLVVDAEFEMAAAHFKAGNGGEAVLALLRIIPPDGKESLPTLRPEFERVQLLDTAAQFSPIDQLKRAFDGLEVLDPRRRLLAKLLIQRAVAAGNFAMAKECMDKVLLRGSDEWERTAASLERAVGRADTEANAESHLAAARAWEAVRGQVTMLSLSWSTYARSEGEKQDLLRRKNAALFGMTDEAITAELDSRDEMHHALNHFLEAARLPGEPAVTAAALEGANEALFRLAETSLYRASRALETDASGLSLQLVDRLKQSFEASPEAERAVVWEFIPPRLLGEWMPGDYSPGNSAYGIERALESPGKPRWDPWREVHRVNREWEALVQRIGALQNLWAGEGALGIGELRELVGGIYAEFDALRPQLDRDQILQFVDHLDDLRSAVAAPNLNAAAFRNYAALRLGGGALPAVEGAWQPLAPWLEFQAVLRLRFAPDDSALRRMQPWQEYLEKFPDGPKSEAASLRVLRTRIRDLLPIPQVEAFRFPEAPIPGGYKRLSRQIKLTPLFLGKLDEAIAEHRSRFPGGRYEADLRLLQAALAAETGRHAEALDWLSAAIDDPAHRELRLDAALQFAEIGLRLLDLDERPAVAAAFRAKPEALKKLRHLAHGDTCLSRLRPLLPWLERAPEGGE